jgi:ABC-type amino acid transport substrate-binding protein
VLLLSAAFLLAACVHAIAQADPAAQAARPVLRVATGEAQPFVLRQGNVLTGFSIDLWNAIAQQMNVDTRFIDLGWRSDAAQLQAVRSGAADAAIAAITITTQREREVDFSIPHYESGLQIMVRADDVGYLASDLIFLLSPALAHLVVAGLLIMFLLANLLWLVQRRTNPLYQHGYLRGIAEGVWGVMLIIATGEYGDRDAPGFVRRLVTASMWLFGVVLIAQFTATVTSSLTVRQLQSSIQGPEDLPGKTIATVPGSIAAEYLNQRGLPFLPMASPERGVAMLVQRDVQAIVFEAPTLQYWAAVHGGGATQIAGPVFLVEYYGIAVMNGSPLRKQINEALLDLVANGTYEALRKRWFSQQR